MSATLHLLPAKSSLCLSAPHAVFIIDCYPHLRAGFSFATIADIDGQSGRTDK